jgi:hypothetical protein
MARLRAHFDGKVLIPVEPVDLPTDRELEIEVTDPGDPPRGSAAAVLKVVRSLPHLSKEDLDEWEKGIEAGKQPAKTTGIFDDLIDQ